jgi:DNA-binding transcriptional MerR regulator
MPRIAAVDGVEDTLTSDEVAARAGITYRQLDHWVRREYVPAPATNSGKPGSGNARCWTPAEASRVAAVATAVRAGFTVSAAARYAQAAAG